MPAHSASRAAILADIHGNADALEAVLSDAAQQSPDIYVLAGDLAMNGPRPAETLARLMALNAPGVMGNMDNEILVGDDPGTLWTKQQLSEAAIAYLAALPISQRITPSDGHSPETDLLIVHSTPRSYEEVLILDTSNPGTNFTEVTPIEEAVQMLAGVRANLMVYGHIHYRSEAVIGQQRVMSIGSVGFPFDGDPRAAYGLAHWNGQNWSVEQRRVVYDYERVARQIEQSGKPDAARYAAMIRLSKWLPRPSQG